MDHKIIQRDIESLIFAEYNPRQLTKDQYKHLKDSITRFGLVDPIIVNKNKERKNIIVGGHQRVKVAKDLKIKKVPVLEIDLTYEKERELNVRLNKNTGEWDYDNLANFFDMDELIDWGFDDKELKLFEDDEIDEIIPLNIDKDIGNIKILNLYAGIGGNRKLWGDLDITSVEYNPEIAEVYKDYFPNDNLIIGDAHKYLEEHFEEYDFIWSSPPCPTHSKMRKNMMGGKSPIYPDMKLWQEIIFLKGYFKGNWVIENVITWYEPLIEPIKIGRHYYWSNFNINYDDKETQKEIELFDENVFDNKKWGYDLNGYKFKSDYNAKKILNNMVHPKTGEAILKEAYGKTEKV